MIDRQKFRCPCWFVVFSFTVCYTCAIENRIPHHDQRFFIREIFDKYGDNGIITFEGFEHLLENLGLGRLSFDKEHNVSMHRINGSFQDVHDALRLHDHGHGIKGNEESYFKIDDDISDHETAQLIEIEKIFPIAGDIPATDDNLKPSEGESTSMTIVKRNAVESTDSSRERIAQPDDGLCLSPQALLQTFGLRPNHSVAIDPARFLRLCPAIVYQLDRRACSVTVTPANAANKVHRGMVSRNEAWLHATLATAVISSVGLLAVLMVKLTRRRSFLHFLIALAVGTLGGDALLHLLPHALLSEGIDHETAALRCSATFLAIIFFYGIETIILLVKSPRKKLSAEITETSFELKPTSLAIKDAEEADSMMPSHNHSHGLPDGASPSLAFLILIGDGLHNLTDGLAIGASFATDPVAGLATSIAVFCHELPHELGDFAVLINSGMSVKRALLYNLLSSALSFIGAAIGLWLGEFDAVSHWIYAVTAGTFLYIAFADLLPEMMSYLKTERNLQGIFIQLAGISSGGTLMLLIALHEDKLHQLLA